MENKNIIITGGIVLKHNGSSVTYKLKCDICGNTESTESTVTVSKNVTEVSTKKCSNCGNNQIIKIKHAAVLQKA